MSKKRQRWSKELIIERIQERHRQGLSLSGCDVRREDNALIVSAAHRRYFGSWEAAIEAARFSYDDVRKAPAPYWSKELIIERILKRHNEGLSLSSKDVQRDDLHLYSLACSDRYFGSWKAAIEAAGFAYSNIRKNESWSKDLIIERIRKRHSEGLSLSSSNVQQNDPALFATASGSLYFGSWEAAIEAAGFSYDDVRKAPAPYWSKELIIERIRRRYDEGLSLSLADVERDDPSLLQAARNDRYFGSWEAAIEAAGFSYDDVRKAPAPYWSKELIIERIRRRYDEGLSLSSKDVQQNDPALFATASGSLYFGSWEVAIEAAGFPYLRVCKIRRMKDLSRSSESEDRATFLQNLGSKKKSRERNQREEE